VSDSSTLHSRWLLFLKIEISSIVHCCFIINLNDQWTIEKKSIFCNSSHLEWRAGLSDIIVKGTLPARFGLIWFSGKDLNVIFYQNMPNSGRDGPWVGPFQNCVRQTRPAFKMAAVTKNRNFFNCPLLLYYKSK
jgi:hypothetical protein